MKDYKMTEEDIIAQIEAIRTDEKNPISRILAGFTQAIIEEHMNLSTDRDIHASKVYDARIESAFVQWDEQFLRETDR